MAACTVARTCRSMPLTPLCHVWYVGALQRRRFPFVLAFELVFELAFELVFDANSSTHTTPSKATLNLSNNMLLFTGVHLDADELALMVTSTTTKQQERRPRVQCCLNGGARHGSVGVWCTHAPFRRSLGGEQH